MTAKRARLVEAARATRRTPRNGDRLAPAPRGFKIVAVSLYTDQAEWVDAIHALLVEGGIAKANRSMVVQGAIEALALQLAAAKTDGSAAAIARFWQELAAARRRAGYLHT